MQDGPQPDDTVQFATRGVYYDLLASVAHIVDGETAGALVSHINVSSRYHQKKEVSVRSLLIFCTIMKSFLLGAMLLHSSEPYPDHLSSYYTRK